MTNWYTNPMLPTPLSPPLVAVSGNGAIEIGRMMLNNIDSDSVYARLDQLAAKQDSHVE